VSGWEQPTPPPPSGSPAPSHWTRPNEADALGPGQLVRSAWRLYRSTPRRFLLVAAIPEVIRDLLAIPGLLVAGRVLQGAFEVMADFIGRVATDPEVYGSADSAALQAQLQAQLQALALPQTDLAAWSVFAGAVGIAVALIGAAALTAAALAAATGRPITVAGAYRLVAARGGLMKPIVALGIMSVAASTLSNVLETSTGFQAWAGAAGSPRSVLLGSLLGVMALIVTIGIVVLAVRWALFMPAVLVEAVGVGPGLARAARLTRGIRIRLGLAMTGIAILNTLTVGIVATVVGFAIGLSAGSVAAGFGAYLVASLIGNVLWAPLLPTLLARAYLRATGAAGSPVAAGT